MKDLRLLVAALAAAAALRRGLRRRRRRARGGGGGDSGESEPVTLKVGVIPIADVAPLYLGIEKGFFEEENLTIEPQLAEGGAAIIPSVMSGDYQIGFSNTTSLIIAASKNLPVQIISQGVLGGTEPGRRVGRGRVPKGSDVKTAKDLEGKTVAVNTLNNIGPVDDQQRLEKDGRRLHEGQVRRGPVPGHGRGAGGQARRRRVHGRAGATRARWRPAARRIFSSYVETAPNLHRRDVLRVQAVHRREPRRRRALPAGDAEVARVRGAANDDEVRAVVGEYTRDPARGDRQDAPADLEGRPQRAHDPDCRPTCRASTASSRRSRRWTS